MSVRVVPPQSDSDSVVPSWITAAFERKKGRDPLGLLSITVDRIMPVLVPGILALSVRARYFSFYRFLLDEVRRHGLTASQDALSLFIKRREFELGLAVVSCPRCKGRRTSVVGADAVMPRSRSQTEAFQREESVESYLGGYGLYYRTPLTELGVVAQRGQALESGELIPLDLLKAEAAETLAQHFRNAVKDTRYYQEYFLGAQPIPREVIEEYALRACLCRLDDFPEERAAIRTALLDMPSQGKPESVSSGGLQAAAEQRRRSVALVLWTITRSPQAVEIAAMEAAFRQTVWSAFEKAISEETTRSAVLGQWAALVSKDYAQEALSSLWSEFCRRGFVEQPPDGMLPADLDRFLRVDLFSDTHLALSGVNIEIEPHRPTAELVDDLRLKLAAVPLESLRESVAMTNTAVSGLVLFLELRNRITTEVLSHPQWRAVAVMPSNWQPGLFEMMASLDRHLERVPTVADTLAWLTERYVIDAHERVAYSKLPGEFTFRFRWEEGHFHFSELDSSRLSRGDTRLNAISRLSQDLGLLAISAEEVSLTPAGHAFVDEVLG